MTFLNLGTPEHAVALITDLYYPDCLALERKVRAAGGATGWVRPADMRFAPPRRRWTAEEDRPLLSASTVETAAEQLGRTLKSCESGAGA